MGLSEASPLRGGDGHGVAPFGLRQRHLDHRDILGGVRASQIVSGREQEIDLTLTTHYRLPSNPKTAVTVAYGVQVNAPLGWRVTPDQWAFSHTLKTSEIGFNETRKLALSVPVGAAQGPHSLQLVITPASGPAQSVNLVLTVVSPGA